MPAAGFYFTEEIQKLATRTVQAAERHHARVLLITSVAENEGKSTVAANLALALAQQDRKVLLIDADLHKASQYKLFRRRVRKSDELAEYLSGRAELQVEYLARKNLYTLFSVEPQPDASELLASERMRAMLMQLREEMDLIILDTPPMALFSDAEALAELADLSLLVVRQDCVAAKRLNDAADTLKQCRAHFLGCVFNDVRRMPSSGGGYGYQYGYGYRYGHSRGYGYGYGLRRLQKEAGRPVGIGGTDEREKVEQENVISLSHLLREFRSVLRKRFWLPLLLAVVCGGSWFLYQRSRYTPMYASEVTFTISVSSSSSSDISRTSAYYSKATAEQLSKTFPYLIQSDLLYTKLSQAMGVSRINGTITAANVPDTNLFTVRVTSSSADDALAILQKLIEVYPEVADYVIGNTSMDLLTEPYAASAPYNAFHPFHVLRNGALAGLAAGLLLLMLAGGLRRTIREERDVQLHLNQTCLAALPCVSFRRSGKKESPPAFHQQ